MELADRHAGDASDRVISFGPFKLDPVKRTLSTDGTLVAISSRAFDILQLLVELRDRVVAKDEIMDRVWPGMFVEENNLAVQISALRRILSVEDGGPQWIVTVSGRGYRFVGRVDETGPTAEAGAPLPVAATLPTKHRPRWIIPAAAVAVVAVILIVGFLNRSALRSAFTTPQPVP